MSATTPENSAKAKVKKAIADYCTQARVPNKIVWNAGTNYGEQTVDATGVIGGIPVAIEVKRFDGKGKVTGRQRLFLREWHAAGGASFLIEDEASLAEFVDWLKRCKFFFGDTR